MNNSARIFFFFFAVSTQTVTLDTTQQFGEQVYSIKVFLQRQAKEGDGV
jgi:hypothetical protein